MAQAFVRRKSRLRVKGLKVKDKEKIKEATAISIQNGNYTTREIGIDLGKDHSTVSRYLAEMDREAKWGIKRDANGNIIISLQKQLANEYRQLENELFNQLTSIQKWITLLKSGGPEVEFLKEIHVQDSPILSMLAKVSWSSGNLFTASVSFRGPTGPLEKALRHNNLSVFGSAFRSAIGMWTTGRHYYSSS